MQILDLFRDKGRVVIVKMVINGISDIIKAMGNLSYIVEYLNIIRTGIH